jgi:hypothetical protein
VPARPYGEGTLKVRETRESLSKLIFKGLVPAKPNHITSLSEYQSGNELEAITQNSPQLNEDLLKRVQVE